VSVQQNLSEKSGKIYTKGRCRKKEVMVVKKKKTVLSAALDCPKISPSTNYRNQGFSKEREWPEFPGASESVEKNKWLIAAGNFIAVKLPI